MSKTNATDFYLRLLNVCCYRMSGNATDAAEVYFHEANLRMRHISLENNCCFSHSAKLAVASLISCSSRRNLLLFISAIYSGVVLLVAH